MSNNRQFHVVEWVAKSDLATPIAKLGFHDGSRVAAAPEGSGVVSHRCEMYPHRSLQQV